MEHFHKYEYNVHKVERINCIIFQWLGQKKCTHTHTRHEENEMSVLEEDIKMPGKRMRR